MEPGGVSTNSLMYCNFSIALLINSLLFSLLSLEVDFTLVLTKFIDLFIFRRCHNQHYYFGYDCLIFDRLDLNLSSFGLKSFKSILRKMAVCKHNNLNHSGKRDNHI